MNGEPSLSMTVKGQWDMSFFTSGSSKRRPMRRLASKTDKSENANQTGLDEAECAGACQAGSWLTMPSAVFKHVQSSRKRET